MNIEETCCLFCDYAENNETVLFENDYALCLSGNDPVLEDSCVIIPKAHKETPFDLSPEEWAATKDILDKVKAYIDKKRRPDGYNLGWNIGQTAGQAVSHAHLYVIPRFNDEPYAGFGIRH